MLTGEVDPELANKIVWTIRHVLMRGATTSTRRANPFQ